jgi:hypothetical protein
VISCMVRTQLWLFISMSIMAGMPLGIVSTRLARPLRSTDTTPGTEIKCDLIET